ncbi:MAG: iron-containing alcohol dehydrogenase [Promethearchaeota archaeon]
MIEPFNFTLPIHIEFGRGVSRKVGELAKSMKAKRVLIITDKGVIKAGLIKGITESLDAKSFEYDIFDEVIPNPTDVVVEKAAKQVKEGKYDLIIAIGGGSSMDTGKGAALLATNPGGIRDYETKAIENHLLPLITIPTTAGTGSEVDYWAVITDTDRNFKMALGQAPPYPGGPYLGASATLVDPLLTMTLPPKQTAATGFDAFSHALETCVARDAKPFVPSLALYAIELLIEKLPIAYADGSNMDAREAVMLAAHLGGICENFANCGIIHSLAEVVGGMYGEVPHGIAIAVFTPTVLEFNYIANPRMYAKIASVMGEKVEGLSAREAARRVIDASRSFIEDLDLPTSLKDIGVRKDDLPKIAKMAMETAEIPGNPRMVAEANLLDILRKAY